MAEALFRQSTHKFVAHPSYPSPLRFFFSAPFLQGQSWDKVVASVRGKMPRKKSPHYRSEKVSIFRGTPVPLIYTTVLKCIGNSFNRLSCPWQKLSTARSLAVSSRQLPGPKSSARAAALEGRPRSQCGCGAKARAVYGRKTRRRRY